MKTPGASYLGLRYAIALAMSTAPFVALDRAEAACDPATSSANPIVNTTVNCTGTTTDQNGTDRVFSFDSNGSSTDEGISGRLIDAGWKPHTGRLAAPRWSRYDRGEVSARGPVATGPLTPADA